MEATPRLFHEPPPSEAHMYEQRGDGCWYYVGHSKPFTQEEYERETRPADVVPEPDEEGWFKRPGDIISCTVGRPPDVPVGDLDSDEKGTGARFNSGKVPMQYIPMEQQLVVLSGYFEDPQYRYLLNALTLLARFEKGKDEALSALIEGLEITDLHAAAFVWEYGANKYKMWNWMKGMPWSVPMGCISRHAQAILMGEELDEESGCEHWGHIVCNLLMLDHYSRYFREGDDRPPARYFDA